jgi:hypothetical protein
LKDHTGAIEHDDVFLTHGNNLPKDEAFNFKFLNISGKRI